MKYLVFLLLLSAVSCSTKLNGPDVVLLDSRDYAEVFDAAVAAANADGMTPVLLDRRGGVITTNPAVAGSFLEPWKPRPSTARQGLENTLAQQRRTARFEFVPVLNEVVVHDDGTDELVGPDYLSSTGLDLTTYEGPMELRVWVYVDRKYTQGIRRNTWSLRQESRTKVLPTEEPWEQVAGSFWTPISRDVARERDLLASVEMRKNAQ
ncbi:MAG TPA: hypothetical protein EYO01_02860 [Phycisphaerales bacterium]|nr:hypothetical protein [Phycisphaerales bacterium]HIB01362.1 hypothetical protein [Phycisphaerales bacterium]HIB50849.1 hypothetical protein [Phycisphaerales bacterium]HIN84326.1 hypothetical protein [Phycisphaerales bacterium]HIO19509.1 hypothetical protein [Phycisphaerales bacterium]